MKSLRAERYYPEIMALISAIACLCFNFQFPKNLDAFLSASLTFSAILIGFLSTAQAIVMSFPSGSVMDTLKSSGYINVLIQYLRLAIYGLLFFSALNLLGFFQPGGLLSCAHKFFWVASCIYSFASFYRIIEIFIKIMKLR